MKMRIPIREQLGAIVLLAALISLAVISIATWVTNHNFVLSVRASRLSLTASLKAAQLTSNLNLMTALVRSASSRIIIQSALQRYNLGNNTIQNWSRTLDDLTVVLQSGGQDALLLQARLYAKNDTGAAGSNTTLVQATGQGLDRSIALGGSYSNGEPIYLGDNSPEGYPSVLYPNFTYATKPYNETFNIATATFGGREYDNTGALLLGPWQLNDTTSILSITVPVINNTSALDVLGWLTVITDARLIQEVIGAEEGLDNTGLTLLLGPSNATNRFPDGILPDSNNGNPPKNVQIGFVVPPVIDSDTSTRHDPSSFGNFRQSFDYSHFPAAERGFTHNTRSANNASSMISTNNEEGRDVSVGYARVQHPIVDWLIILEQSHEEVWQPINHLRNILLACIFGTLGGMILLAFPAAHYFSRPIRRLRDATKRSLSPVSIEPDTDSSADSPAGGDGPSDEDPERALARKEGFFESIKKLAPRRTLTDSPQEVDRRKNYKIPAKVIDGKHFIHDELTDLTGTFNEMSDELMMQYEKLEDRVKQRTVELETSKKAAEEANEAKTLFIANISHELKTPLNGILGMAAVAMTEDDPKKMKHSLGIIYKSGDLLSKLLTDLLTFSKNQVGQNLSLDEKEFRLRDISSQIFATFEKQAKDSGIDLSVRFEGPTEANTDAGTESENQKLSFAPFGLGKVKDMVLFGDSHRILQVVINFVSNSLKFTPSGGSVTATIRCTGAGEAVISRKTSVQSHQTSGQASRTKSPLRSGSESSVVTPELMKTATHINGMDKATVFSQVTAKDRSTSPPPGRILEFEFEVVDTGPGIPESQRKKIFEPFVQGDLGLNKKYGGTGLGLSICSQIATLLKGNISLQSEEGQGSTFTLQIPLRHLHNRSGSTASSSIGSLASRRNSVESASNRAGTAEALTSRNSTSQPYPLPFEGDSQPRLVGLSAPYFASNEPLESPGSQAAAMERIKAEVEARDTKVRVLVAEDNKINQEVVLKMLKLEDIYDVTVAKDGQEALDLVMESMQNHRPYNLIFMDVQMPNLDGLASTRLIRQAGYVSPIVALTAYSGESNIKDCLESGMDGFLAKPIKRPLLKQVLKTYCAPIQEEDEPSPLTDPTARPTLQRRE